MKIWAVLLAAAASLAFAAAAEARYLSAAAGYRAIYWDNQRAEQEVNWPARSDIGSCARLVLSRYECQAGVKGDELYEVIRGHYNEEGFWEPIRFIYLHRRCDWVGVAKWRFRSVIVTRRELSCDHWYDESTSQ